jgi:sodium-dependent dicarboxylate transporter 2/3/5
MNGGAKSADAAPSRARLIGFWLGLLAALGVQLLPVPDGLTREAWVVVSLAVLMSAWWATEAIPIPVTALLPLIVLPLSGAVTMNDAAARYAEPTVFLFLGGFIIAMAIERWGLHARIALNIAARFGARPGAMMLGVMCGAAALSMWISNTATAIMLAPIALRVAAQAEEDGAAGAGYATAMMLGVAYAANIGGMGTPIGTPTNLLAMGWLADNGSPVSFVQWMLIGTPLVWALTPVAWFVLSRRVKAGPHAESAGIVVRQHLAELGPVRTPEARVMMLFAAVALAWIFRPLIATAPFLSQLSDTGVAIIGAAALFLIPAGDGTRAKLLDWQTAERLPWGVVLLFGGGLSLAYAMEATGLAAALGEILQAVGFWPLGLLLLALVALTVFVTEFMSNVAAVSALLPLLGAVALASGVDPMMIGVAAGIAASMGFTLPVSTPPNAVVFATGRIPIAAMIRTGLVLDLISIPVIAGAVLLLAPLVFG